MQTKRWSLIEAFMNVGIGLGVAVMAQIIVFPWFGLALTLVENFAIAGIFTAVSIARSYCVRRFFNWLHHVKGIGRQGYYVLNK